MCNTGAAAYSPRGSVMKMSMILIDAGCGRLSANKREPIIINKKNLSWSDCGAATP